MSQPALNSEELCAFLEKTLAELDSAAGDVDEEAHQKLALLKSTLTQGNSQTELLSEASIMEEMQRIDGRLSDVEQKIAQADPMTKNLLGMSAEILTKGASSESEAPKTDQ